MDGAAVEIAIEGFGEVLESRNDFLIVHPRRAKDRQTTIRIARDRESSGYHREILKPFFGRTDVNADAFFANFGAAERLFKVLRIIQ